MEGRVTGAVPRLHAGVVREQVLGDVRVALLAGDVEGRLLLLEGGGASLVGGA